jgi:hypothetical protein
MTTKQLEKKVQSLINPNWTVESDNGFAPEDLSNITLKHYLKAGEDYITSDESRARMGKDKPLSASVFFRLWENKDLIPDDWITYGDAGYIEFRGTVLRRSDGIRCFLCLYRSGGGSWRWGYLWLDRDRDRGYVSPVLASTESLTSLPSEPLDLVLRVEALERFYERAIELIPSLEDPETI